MNVKFNSNLKSLAVLFPGQGIQYVGLLNEFLNSSKQFITNSNIKNYIDIYDRYIFEKGYLENLVKCFFQSDPSTSNSTISYTENQKQIQSLNFSDILLYDTCSENYNKSNLNVQHDRLNKIKSMLLNDSSISQLSINLFTKIRFNQYINKLKEEFKNQELNIFMFGRSLGELNSLLTCNLTNFNYGNNQDLNMIHKEIDIIYTRGEYVKKYSPKGGMLNVIGDINKTIKLIKSYINSDKYKNIDPTKSISISIAGIHSLKSIVLSGSIEDLNRLSEFLKSNKLTSKLLSIPNPYHSNFMISAKTNYEIYLNEKLLKLENTRKIENFNLHFISSVDFTNASNQLLFDNMDIDKNQLESKIEFKVIDYLLNFGGKIGNFGGCDKVDISDGDINENQTSKLIKIIGDGLILPYNTTRIFNFLKNNNIQTYCLSTNSLVDYSSYL